MSELDNGEHTVRLSEYSHSFSRKNKIGRLIWNVAYWIIFRPFNLNAFKAYRATILRLFGAKVGAGANIYASAKIWAPWNLKIGEYSTIGPDVDVYNQGHISIGSNTVISQKAYLCASSHDYTRVDFPLYCDPIVIEDSIWIAAEAFIGPGVFIEDGAVVGARAAVFKNVDKWTIVGGNPAKFIKKREIIS